MALSIKTQEADRLARALSHLTGESITRAVTIALRERLERERERERVRRAGEDDLAKRLTALAARIAPHYDTRPVTRDEWDAACGDEF